MRAPSTPASRDAPAEAGRTVRRAVADLREGLSARSLWGHLGWQDIRARYRRSVLGPFWIAISQAVIAVGLGLLYGVLFHTYIPTFIPYLLTGLITWNLIQGCLTEGMETFIANEG